MTLREERFASFEIVEEDSYRHPRERHSGTGGGFSRRGGAGADRDLPEFFIRTAQEEGWSDFKNGTVTTDIRDAIERAKAGEVIIVRFA